MVSAHGETSGGLVHKADVIDAASVLYVYVLENRGLRRVSVPEVRELGRDVFEVWMKLLAATDSFVPIEVSAMLAIMVDARSTSFLKACGRHIRDRYAVAHTKGRR